MQCGDEEYIVVVLQFVVQMAEQFGIGFVNYDQNAGPYIVAADEQFWSLFQAVRFEVMDQRSNGALAARTGRQFEFNFLAILEQQLQTAFQLDGAVQLGHLFVPVD